MRGNLLYLDSACLIIQTLYMLHRFSRIGVFLDSLQDHLLVYVGKLKKSKDIYDKLCCTGSRTRGWGSRTRPGFPHPSTGFGYGFFSDEPKRTGFFHEEPGSSKKKIGFFSFNGFLGSSGSSCAWVLRVLWVLHKKTILKI